MSRAQRRGQRRTWLRAALAGVVAAAGLTVVSVASDADAGEAGANAGGGPQVMAQLESLDRGLVSVNNGSGNLVSWRYLASDPDDVAFNVYRGEVKVNDQPITGSTNFFHPGAPSSADYRVRAVVGGVEQAFSPHAIQFRPGYYDVPIQPPAGGTVNGSSYTYEANDASVGDLNGDGTLEFVLKWQPTNAKDNSQSGYTGNTIIDGYTLSGQRLWRIDLGRDIRSGAH